jgi:hypothetical protein
MFSLPPLDHTGRPIPVPRHHLFGWNIQGRQALASFLGWMVIWPMLLLVRIVPDMPGPAAVVDAAPLIALLTVVYSFGLTVLFVGVPLAAWPWARKGYGRRLAVRIGHLSDAELDSWIEGCARESDTTGRADRRAALREWADWLQKQRDTRAAGPPRRSDTLTLRPPARKLLMSTLGAMVLLAPGAWFVALAVLGGDGGTGIEGFSGPNAVWVKSGVGGLMLLVGAVPLLEACTVRVDLDAFELRKRQFGRTIWAVPRQHVRLVETDLPDGCGYEVRDAQLDKRIGTLNIAHYGDGDLIRLMEQLRSDVR